MQKNSIIKADPSRFTTFQKMSFRSLQIKNIETAYQRYRDNRLSHALIFKIK